MDDGIGLSSTAHPASRFSWLTILWWRITRKDVRKSSLQTVEMVVDKATGDLKIIRR